MDFPTLQSDLPAMQDLPPLDSGIPGQPSSGAATSVVPGAGNVPAVNPQANDSGSSWLGSRGASFAIGLILIAGGLFLFGKGPAIIQSVAKVGAI